MVKEIKITIVGSIPCIKEIAMNNSYQAFYSLKHYNLLETVSFLIRKLNQPTGCLMLQFKSKNTLKLLFDSSPK